MHTRPHACTALIQPHKHSAPITVVGHHLRKLGLTEEAEMAYPDLAEKIHAVREEAVKTALAWWVELEQGVG